MSHDQDILTELSRRVQRLEQAVFGKKNAIAHVLRPEHDLQIPTEIRSALLNRIRRVPYWDLVIVLLYFAKRPLTYANIMTQSKELKKPVSYKWLDTEFHRKQYSGLVRSESVAGSKEKAYSLNEPGRRRAEIFLHRLKTDTQTTAQT